MCSEFPKLLWTVFATLLLQSLVSLRGNSDEGGYSLQVLHEFDFERPIGGLVRGADGRFYGVAASGGTNRMGSVFSATSSGKISTLASFDKANGGYFSGPLIQGRNGNFYGATGFGGAHEAGTLFQMTPAGELTTLVSFALTNGYRPYGRLLEASDGNIYGTTMYSTTPYKGDGIVFQFAPSGTLKTLLAFNSVNNGAQPLGELIEGNDGWFYGATSLGRQSIFRISREGAFTPLAYLNSTNGAGFVHLLRSRDGNFYGCTAQGGSTAAGGSPGDGTFFKMSAEGVFTLLASFSEASGAFPNGLIESADGSFYGTTGDGGPNRTGTVFQITPAGQITTLAALPGRINQQTTSTLAEGLDGNLYGTTPRGGKNDAGIFYRVVQAPRLFITRSNLATVVAWNSFVGGQYLVQFNANLSQTNWIDLTNSIAGEGGANSLTIDPSASPQKYFRVVLLP